MQRDGYARPPRDPQAVSRRDLLRLGRGPLFAADIDHDGATERIRAAWDRDGHEPLLRALEPVADALVSLAGVGPGHRVLDAATGDGNLARASLARGAHVDACDLAPSMLTRAARRCPDARFTLGDVQALPYPDGTFDAVLSSFGFALAPRPRRTAHELVRVCRAGGTVTLAAWAPRGLPGRLDDWIARPSGIPAPALWGHEPRLRQRLEPLLDAIIVRTRTVTLEFASPDALFQQLVAPEDRTATVRAGFDALLEASNDRPGATVVSARYLLVSGVVRDTPRSAAR
jgi:ubiquinone/menaquinone biosynthesis C-methylase UbiE